jgi:superfamily II DNA or RNA helicase
VIATWQSLQNNPQVVTDFQCLIVDEAHGASAKTIGDLITEHGKHIAYRYGFTGTIPKPETDRLTLRGSLGEVLYRITAAELIAMGYLAQLEIEPVEIQEKVDEEFPDYSAEKAYTSKSAERLDFLADLIIARASQYGNTLVLVNTIKQGQQLQKLIKNSVFLHGATESDVRAEWYSTFAERDDLIVIATSGIASTGISIDRVFCLMLIDAGKSFIKCIQSIGRGLRIGHDKTFVHVTDVYTGLKWGRKHSRERARFYKDATYPVLKIAKAKL